MRIPYFDNARLILIFFVVLGHLIEKTAINNPLCYSVYVFIYLFHIPAFTLISGFFSKKAETIPRKIKNYLIYYLIFEFIYAIALSEKSSMFLVNPYWIMWYLLSLILWNIMLMFFIKLKHPIVLAFIIGIATGYINRIGYVLSLSRTFVFFPFFITGYYLKQSDLDKLNTFNIKALKGFANEKCCRYAVKCTSATVITSIFMLVNKFRIPHKWLYGSYSYAALGHPEWYAGVYRLCIYAITSILCLSIFILIPHKKFRFTYIGANSLNTYLLHGIFVMAVPVFIKDTKNIICVIALALLITLLLSTNMAANALKMPSRIFLRNKSDNNI